jgi:hypothetical protein
VEVAASMVAKIGEPVEVDGEEFFHYQPAIPPYYGQTRVAPWVTGQTIPIGADFNLFFQQFEFHTWSWPISDGESYGGKNALDHILAVIDGQTGPVENFKTSGVYEPLVALRRAVDVVRRSTNMARELVFEEVRQKLFPRLPSRQRCIWVAPDEASARVWQGTLDDTARLFGVRLAGHTHRADARWVGTDTRSLRDIRAFAERYWTGTNGVASPADEVLFVGTVTVVEELPRFV